ncbi:inositol monophosphatase family protein [Bacillaceae bacterium IKA-2]|nr:inositol monophosphatase family protein [Bacillaceae bacterium IKA-2]
MKENDWNKLAAEASSFVKEAAQIIKESFDKELIVEYKSNPNDLVTDMDKKIEAFFQKKITSVYPAHLILGEEGTGEDIQILDGVVWIIDPIDGTTNFVHQQRHFAISVGIYENGIGKVGIIYDVIGDELFSAISGQGAYLNGQELPKLKTAKIKEAIIGVNAGLAWRDDALRQIVEDCRGTRSYGSAAIEMAYVAANRLDAYISLSLSPWDFAAGAIILEEVGAIITTIKGEELNFLKASSICVAKQGLYQQLQTEYLKIEKGG